MTKIPIQDCYEELYGIDSWEVWYGTDATRWFEEYDGYYPYWLGYVSDKAAAREYAHRNRGVWEFGLEDTHV